MGVVGSVEMPHAFVLLQIKFYQPEVSSQPIGAVGAAQDAINIVAAAVPSGLVTMYYMGLQVDAAQPAGRTYQNTSGNILIKRIYFIISKGGAVVGVAEVGDDVAGRTLQTIQSLVGTYPDVAVVGFQTHMDGFVAQPFGSCVDGEIVSVKFIQAVPGAKPHVAIAVLHDKVHGVGRQTFLQQRIFAGDDIKNVMGILLRKTSQVQHRHQNQKY